MSTDITIQITPERVVVDFDAFARTDLDELARACSLVAGDPDIAASAVHAAVDAAHTRWRRIGFDNEPSRFVFGHATTSVAGASNDPDSVVARACVVAAASFDWSHAEIATALGLHPDQVDEVLHKAHEAHVQAQERAEHRGEDDGAPKTLREDTLSQLASTAFVTPDVDAIKQARRSSMLRKRTSAAMVALALLAVAASFIANSSSSSSSAISPSDQRSDTDQTQAQQAETERPAPIPEEPAGEPLAGEIGNEPRPDLIPFPELITTDGDGGFVGVRSPTPQNAQIVFTRSDEGDTWSLVSRWNLGAQVQVERLERSGDYYVVWLANTPQTTPTVVRTMAVSTDLVGWTVLELAIDDDSRGGLVYNRVVQDVSVSDGSVLALVTTTVEIDFAALSLFEGSTCGRTITNDEVRVNLCNGGEIDVLSLTGITRLPDRSRLFVSRDGLPFEPVDAPFGDSTPARLAAVNGAFAVTDDAGVRFATSTDAETWTTVIAGKPPFPVQAAASDDSGQLVGLGRGSDGAPLLFQSDGRTTNALPLVDLVGEISPDAKAVVASGSVGWVVYLFEPQTNAWLLTSEDGLSWDVLPSSPPIGSAPRLLVGDNEVLIQWLDSDDQMITLGVPLP